MQSTSGVENRCAIQQYVQLYRRSTIFHCHLIFAWIGEKMKIKKMKIYNTIQNSGTVT